MKTIELSTIDTKEVTVANHEIEDFYETVTEDYKFWSRNFNMHFGYLNQGKSLPFLRESMLIEFNRQIMMRLNLKQENKVADFGCGMGGPMRYILSKNPTVTMDGVTLSPFQVREGNKLLSMQNGKIHLADYAQTKLPSASYHGVMAIESLCHSGHSIKPLLEANRLLKPGGRFVIADAFLKVKKNKLKPRAKSVYEGLCSFWKVNDFESTEGMKAKLEQAGFKDIVIEDVSNRVAVSVLHSLATIPLFVLLNWIKGKAISPLQWHNMKGAYFAMLTGLHLNSFGYYFITATKA